MLFIKIMSYQHIFIFGPASCWYNQYYVCLLSDTWMIYPRFHACNKREGDKRVSFATFEKEQLQLVYCRFFSLHLFIV